MKRTYFFPVIFFIMLVITSCTTASEDIIMTVNGPVPSSEMGITLTHEHVLVDFIGADSTGYHRWNKQEVVEVVTPYLLAIQNLNVSTFIDCTPKYIGRDPELLKRLSHKTGMHFITNTGYYGAVNNKFIPSAFYQMSAQEVSALWIEEFENGIEGSGIRPGFIKIGVNPDDTLSPEHKKIITAAALTHQKTGLVIASHTGPEQPAFEQIKVLEAQGVDPSAFIWVHAQKGSLEGNIRAARSGAWISLDNVKISRPPDAKFNVKWYAERIIALQKANLLHKVLISHDAGWYSPGEENGGSFRGFTGIFEVLVPLLKRSGFSQSDLDQLLITNPRVAFTLKVPA